MITEIPYGQFSQEIHNLEGVERIPLSGAIELTYRCNLKCVHCLTACNWSKEKELKKYEIFRIVDEAVESGCLWLLLSGGDPLLREDFLDIYTYIKKKGVFVSIFTNGTLITEKIADCLAKWRPFSVEITLHSMNKTIFDSITGVPGSFEKCMQGIRLLLERRIPLELKTMVMTLNKDEIEAIKQYAEKLGINYRFSARIEPKIDGSKNPLQFRIKSQEVVEIDKNFLKHRIAYEKRCKNLIPVESGRLYTCSAGLFTFHITPYGKLMPCDMLSNPSYDLRQISFASGWLNLNKGVQSRKASKHFKCIGCEMISICDACPALFLRETGDEEEVSEFYCQVAHLRAKTFKGGEFYEKTLQKTQN